jgi:hypothetical protein
MNNHLARRGIIAAIVTFVLAGGGSLAGQRSGATVEVFKTPTCGCCHLWVKHLEQNGFTTKVTDMDDLSAVKRKHGVPARATSCHTAIVNGYVLEGHVPAAEVKKLLIERPAIAGLAVPGMPVGSPGMEVGSTVQPYNVLSFDKTGETKLFASYGRR